MTCQRRSPCESGGRGLPGRTPETPNELGPRRGHRDPPRSGVSEEPVVAQCQVEVSPTVLDPGPDQHRSRRRFAVAVSTGMAVVTIPSL
jgi:hypothetical protein